MSCPFFYLCFLLSVVNVMGIVGDIDAENPGKDDFELWSPSEERSEQCLFGRQVGVHFAFFFF